MNQFIRMPVVTQTRKILTGENKGKIIKVLIWCKYLDDIPKYRKLHTMVNGPNAPSYKITDVKLEIRYGPNIKETYEEEVT